MSQATSHSAFNSQLKKYYTWYTGGFIAFLIFLAIAEQMGMSRAMIGYIFLAATIGLYAGIGIMSRTAEALGVERSYLYKKMKALGLIASKKAGESGGEADAETPAV